MMYTQSVLHCLRCRFGLVIFYISMIATISVATCTTSVFVLLERYALENPCQSQIPCWLRWLDIELHDGHKKRSSRHGHEAGNEPIEDKELFIDNMYPAVNRDTDAKKPDSVDSRKQVTHWMSFRN